MSAIPSLVAAKQEQVITHSITILVCGYEVYADRLVFFRCHCASWPNITSVQKTLSQNYCVTKVETFQTPDAAINILKSTAFSYSDQGLQSLICSCWSFCNFCEDYSIQHCVKPGGIS